MTSTSKDMVRITEKIVKQETFFRFPAFSSNHLKPAVSIQKCLSFSLLTSISPNNSKHKQNNCHHQNDQTRDNIHNIAFCYSNYYYIVCLRFNIIKSQNIRIWGCSFNPQFSILHSIQNIYKMFLNPILIDYITIQNGAYTNIGGRKTQGQTSHKNNC